MEEAIVHEKNFRESITMLVVPDDMQSDDDGQADSDTEAHAHKNLDHIKENPNQIPMRNTQGEGSKKFNLVDIRKQNPDDGGLDENENEKDTEALIKSQKYNANIQAARRFLAMGEQRGSFCTSGGGSARSSYDPEAD